MQEQREVPWKFSVFILTETNDVERDKNTGLLNLKSGFGVETYAIKGKMYACMFTSREAIKQYVHRVKCPELQIVEIENAHDFITIFGQIIGPDVDHIIIDFSGDESQFAFGPIQPLLDLMHRMVADQIDGTYGKSSDLPQERREGRQRFGEGPEKQLPS